MPVPTPIDLNDTTPGAPQGRVNVRWQADVLNPRHVSAYVLLGGVNAQTSNVYAVVNDDQGSLVTFNNVGAVAVSLPSAALLLNSFWLMIENLGSGVVNVTPDTSTIDGAGSLALTQDQGCAIFSDGVDYWTMRGIGGGSGGLAGVNLQPGDYTANATDNGKLVVMTKATAKVLTLPAAPPSATWAAFIQNIGAGALTINRNGLMIDNVAASLTTVQSEGVVVFTDGSNYFTERGMNLVKSVAGRTGVVTLVTADVGIARADVTINAGSLAPGAQATGTVAIARTALLQKVVANSKSRLRLYQTTAGRNSDASRAWGTAVPGSVGLLFEIRWNGIASLTYPVQPPTTLFNGDGSTSANIYWTAENLELTTVTPTFDCTYLTVEP